MTRIVTNNLLHPTQRNIQNIKGNFITSDGPNTSSFIDLSDIGIPYDSHYISRIVLPANTDNFFLNYGSQITGATFLLIKVTYNGNYDFPMEDSYDPLYIYEPENYNINYYFEANSGVTYPIGRLLLLNGSYNNNIANIYLNNPLGYDVVLHVLHAHLDDPVPVASSSASTISNLYFTDVITNKVSCTVIYTGTTTTTTTAIPTTTTTTTSAITTTTTTTKELMRIIVSSGTSEDYYEYIATGNTNGLFDYYKDGEWIFDGENKNSKIFTDLSGIGFIRFYFELNDDYYGTLKTDFVDPIFHNTDLYFIDIDLDGNYIPPVFLTGTTTTTTTTTQFIGSYTTGSTSFIITEFVPNITGYTPTQYIIPYNIIISIEKNTTLNYIYINTTLSYYTLKFLTDYDCNQTYCRMIFSYDSFFDNSCRYLTEEHSYLNGNIVNC